jgi:hypothetical protein
MEGFETPSVRTVRRIKNQHPLPTIRLVRSSNWCLAIPREAAADRGGDSAWKGANLVITPYSEIP